MKKQFFLAFSRFVGVVGALLAAALLCACGAASLPAGVSSGGAPASVGTESAPSGKELALPDGCSRFKITALEDGTLYLVGSDAEAGLRAYTSSDAGDTWTQDALNWDAGYSAPVLQSILPGGKLLVTATDATGKQALLVGSRETPFFSIDLFALQAYDGLSSFAWASEETVSVTAGNYETYTGQDGKEQKTVVPYPSKNFILQTDGTQVAEWGQGGAGDLYFSLVCDTQRLFLFDGAAGVLNTLDASGSLNACGSPEKWNGSAVYASNGTFYYVSTDGIRQMTADGKAACVLEDAAAPYLTGKAFGVELCVTQHHAFVLYANENDPTEKLYRAALS